MRLTAMHSDFLTGDLRRKNTTAAEPGRRSYRLRPALAYVRQRASIAAIATTILAPMAFTYWAVT